MASEEIRFEDGAGYERYMGRWSQAAGATFLAWLAPPAGLCWLDVGCGNGAFTELLAERASPARIEGLDPSKAQLEYARRRPATRHARFSIGDAQDLPYERAAFDAAVMSLVIFFVPDPARGVSEMARVVAPGGTVAAYAWDMEGNGFPYEPLLAELRALGVSIPMPPSPDASRLDRLRDLWSEAGLSRIETRAIDVQRAFSDFDDYWDTVRLAPSMGPRLKAMSESEIALLRGRLCARLVPDRSGRIVCTARANAVRGRVPGPQP